MQVTVFGASGRVGRLVVEELLARKHQPTVFVHRHNPFEGNVAVTVVRGDIHVADDVCQALEGSDAVISTLGSWGTKQKDVVSGGMAVIIPTMRKLGLRRIVSLTGADAHDTTDKPGAVQKISHMASGLLLGKIVKDGEKHIRLLRASDLEWTVIRSPVMNTFGGDNYALRPRWSSPVRTINRRAVAKAMVDQLDSRDFICKSPTIFRR
ncbi:MAG: NAD(P)H-binding protein [Candidatus Saccharimonadales bacterium]